MIAIASAATATTVVSHAAALPLASEAQSTPLFTFAAPRGTNADYV